MMNMVFLFAWMTLSACILDKLHWKHIASSVDEPTQNEVDVQLQRCGFPCSTQHADLRHHCEWFWFDSLSVTHRASRSIKDLSGF